MKLIDLLSNLDFLVNIELIEDKESVYKGSVFDVPWVYGNYELDTDSDGDAIYVPEKDSLLVYIKEV